MAGIVGTATRRLICWSVTGIRSLLPIPHGVCRFTPSCTDYAAQALIHRSLPVALFLIARRILRCNPLFPGGYDPVPIEER